MQVYTHTFYNHADLFRSNVYLRSMAFRKPSLSLSKTLNAADTRSSLLHELNSSVVGSEDEATAVAAAAAAAEA